MVAILFLRHLLLRFFGRILLHVIITGERHYLTLSEGVDSVKISKRLGHANPKITLEFYAHLLPNADNDIADIFHNAIQSNTK